MRLRPPNLSSHYWRYGGGRRIKDLRLQSELVLGQPELQETLSPKQNQKRKKRKWNHSAGIHSKSCFFLGGAGGLVPRSLKWGNKPGTFMASELTRSYKNSQWAKLDFYSPARKTRDIPLMNHTKETRDTIQSFPRQNETLQNWGEWDQVCEMCVYFPENMKEPEVRNV